MKSKMIFGQSLFAPFLLTISSLHLRCSLTAAFGACNARPVRRQREGSTILYATKPLETTKDGVYIVDAMPEPLPEVLKNTYFLLRHGQSWGNVAGVISSARSLARSEKHSLTPLGYEQGKDSAGSLLSLIEKQMIGENNDATSPKKLFFYSSPFSRARQTALACLDGIAIEENEKKVQDLNIEVQKELVIEDGLMERFFGRLDDEAIHTYAYVWPVDMYDTTHCAFDVESVAAVSTRLREVILKIEESSLHNNGDGDIIVLTSHADVLQIMQLYACGAENVGTFSSYRFGNGEVRLMGRSPDTLPEPQPLAPPKIGT